MTSTNKKRVSFLLKAAILLLAAWFIYHKFLEKDEDLNNLKILLKPLSKIRVAVMMTIIVLLMLLNWLLESLKWQYITRKLAHLTLWEAIECVFCGLTWAASTPNRLGEYGGRVMFLPYRKRIHGVFAMVVAGIGQNAITNTLGLSALLWFIPKFLHMETPLYLLICVLSVAFIAFTMVFYFNIGWLVALLDKIKFVRKYHRFFDVMGRYRSNELINIIGFCLSRYCVFTSQYFLLIHMFIPQMPAFEMLMMLSIMFFVQSALPSLDLLDIGVRSGIASALFAFITTQHAQQLAVIAVVSTIYIVNLIIPAILGSVFVFKLRFFDRTA